MGVGSLLGRFSMSKTGSPPGNKIEWGDLRRTSPLSRKFGFDRGGAVDRAYIEGFLNLNRSDIRGRVLELKDNAYTRRFGSRNVSQSDILDINPRNRKANIISDLTTASNIPDNVYDCVILTQVLQFIYDYNSAICNIYRILKPGGVLIMTVPGITQIAYSKLGTTWYWSFSEASVTRILAQHFKHENTSVTVYGNVLTAVALLYGIGVNELASSEYEVNDPDYQLIIGSRAVK